jgi:hypothetical protein
MVFVFYFLPLFIELYFLLLQKNFVLLTSSLFFYAWDEWLFVLLQNASGLGNYFWPSGLRKRMRGLL